MTVRWCAGWGGTILETDPRQPYAGVSGSQPSWSSGDLRCNFDGEGMSCTLLQSPTKTYVAVLIPTFQISAVWSGASDGQEAYFLQLRTSDTIQALMLRQVYHSGPGDFTIKLVSTTAGGADDQTDEGSTHFSYGSSIGDLRVTSNGSTVTVEVDTGSGFVEECSISTSLVINRFRPNAENKSDASAYALFGSPSCMIAYDTASERLGIPAITKLYPGADANTYTDFTTGTTGGGGEEYTEVDDWNGGTYDSDTTYREAASVATSATVRTSYPVNATFSPSNDRVRVTYYGRSKGTGSAKTGDHYALVTDGTNTLENLTVSGASSGAYQLDDYVWQTAPDGGQWVNYANWASLEVGLRFTNGTDGAQNIRLTVAQLEVWDFPADPPAGGGGAGVTGPIGIL